MCGQYVVHDRARPGLEPFPFSCTGSTGLHEASNGEKPRRLPIDRDSIPPAARNAEMGNALARPERLPSVYVTGVGNTRFRRLSADREFHPQTSGRNSRFGYNAEIRGGPAVEFTTAPDAVPLAQRRAPPTRTISGPRSPGRRQGPLPGESAQSR